MNIMTFNPGWDRSGGTLPEFDEVRNIQRMLKGQGVALDSEVDEGTCVEAVPAPLSPPPFTRRPESPPSPARSPAAPRR